MDPDTLFRPDSIPGGPATIARTAALDLAFGELSDGWAEGRNPRAEEFLDRLGAVDPSSLVELVYHEFCLAEAAGLMPDPSEYLDRFPALRDDLARLFGLHDAFNASTLRSWVAPFMPLP